MGMIESKVLAIVESVIGSRSVRTGFTWLENRHTQRNCGQFYEVIERIFADLGGSHEGLLGKRHTVLPPDAYFPAPFNFILEVDELQHFTPQKGAALRRYPEGLGLGFSVSEYLTFCSRYGAEALRKGPSGYRKRTPEFPFEYGRTAQRAYFDSFRDLLAPLHGLRPTLRIPVPADAVHRDDVEVRVRQYLAGWVGQPGSAAAQR